MRSRARLAMAPGIWRRLNLQNPTCGSILRNAGYALVRDGSPAEAALLRLFWVKRELLNLHPLNQFLDPIK
jgi:hypothetical protein